MPMIANGIATNNILFAIIREKVYTLTVAIMNSIIGNGARGHTILQSYRITFAVINAVSGDA